MHGSAGRFSKVVEKRRILVVDDSPAMRETLCVLLGAAHHVDAISGADLDRLANGPGDPDLVIAGSNLRASTALRGVPVLWLGEADGLPRRFTPTELRRRVTAALAAPRPVDGTTATAQRWLRGPFLDADARAVVEQAQATGLALHIAGEPGSGKHAVARALHQEGAFLICDAARPVPRDLDGLREPATLLAIGVDRWPEEAQRALAIELAAAPPRLRILSTATRDLAELRDSGAFLPDLYYRLTLLSLHLRPLRERPDDIPDIADDLAADIAARMGRPQPTFSTAARRRLAHYLWFGNVAELRAVLTRSLALAPGGHIDVDDLRFEGAGRSGPVASAASAAAPTDEPRESRRAAATTAASPEPVAAEPHREPEPAEAAAADEVIGSSAAALGDPGAGAPPAGEGNGAAPAAADAEARPNADAANNLDMIIQELAHEFKNPLVAIKTFTQHCQKSLPEGDADEVRFAELTERAAEQMDQVLENLLAFTRMTEPQPQVVALDRLLAPLFANGSGARVDYIAPPPVRVRVDPEQVSYAIDNLLRALLRDAPPGRQMTAQFCPPDALLCQLPSGPASAHEKLRELVADGRDGDDEAALADAMPLGVALASALLERNGAELRMTREGDPKTVMIRFPLVENEEEVEARNGTSPRIGG